LANLVFPLHTSSSARSPLGASLSLFCCVAVAFPALLAWNAPPSATFLNQALSLVGWGFLLWGLTIFRLGTFGPRALAGDAWPVTAMLLILLAAVFASAVLSGLPVAMTLSSAGMLLASLLVFAFGTSLDDPAQRKLVFQAFCISLVVAGVLSLVVAAVQQFAPGWADGAWIAHDATPGRAGGNLRQPNHLSSLLVWSLIAGVSLHETWFERATSSTRSVGRIVTAALLAALVLGVVLTVSRTGMLCVLALATWGLADRRLSRFSRTMLGVLPIVYVAGWLLAAQVAQSGAHAFAGETQLHSSDLSSSRFGIWANALSLIQQHPWFGVSWGEFNFAWTLTPFPGRPGAFFDHTHNLPLQLLVELGLPLGIAVLLLLATAICKALRSALVATSDDASVRTAAFVMVATMTVHSMLEYPLWYAYFLLPTLFALGMCLGPKGPAQERPLSRPRLGTALAVLLIAGTVVSVLDYRRVVVIFSPSANAAPLPDRIADGQRSWLFAHHADYAAGTIAEHPGEALTSFKRSTHYLLDTRLMMAWAKALEESGDTDRARYVAQRLREFNNPGAAEFFAPCEASKTPSTPLPFQCLQPTRPLSFEDFR
jgi:O-antigen ligase